MSAADIKFQIVKLLENQPVEVLENWLNLLNANVSSKPNDITEIELAYKAMIKDAERETEANEWIENTLNSDEL